MLSAAEVIREMLIDLSLATDIDGAWPVYVGFLPTDPANAVCVYDTAGKMDGRLLSTGEQIVHGGLQIRTRGPVYTDVRDKIHTIATTLDAQKNVVVVIDSDTSYTVQNVSRTSDIIPLGIEEENGRLDHHFTVNGIITMKED